MRIFSGALLFVGIFTLALGVGIFYMGTNKTDDIKVISAGETSADVYSQSPLQNKQSEKLGQVAGELTGSLINVNTATAAELDKLSGVGPVTSGKIIANRPYSSLEQLVLKGAISRSLLIKISSQITAGE
ncbi:MAG: helix-hairpin-helix domain-containing protein [Patescibacteria group bacterium]